MSLLDVLRGVMLDPAEQAVYDADPGAYLEQYGYQDVDPADLSEAFGLVADTLPADQALAAWSGESGPQSPALGDDTADFDDGGPDDALAALDDANAQLEALDEDVDDALEADSGDDPALSFGLGDEDDAADGAADGLDDDLGVFGSAAPDADGVGPLDGTDDLGTDDGFGGFTDEGLDHGLDDTDDGFDDDLDDTDDLAEIDGLGPVDHGPDDVDIGSF